MSDSGNVEIDFRDRRTDIFQNFGSVIVLFVPILWLRHDEATHLRVKRVSTIAHFADFDSLGVPRSGLSHLLHEKLFFLGNVICLDQIQSEPLVVLVHLFMDSWTLSKPLDRHLVVIVDLCKHNFTRILWCEPFQGFMSIDLCCTCKLFWDVPILKIGCLRGSRGWKIFDINVFSSIIQSRRRGALLTDFALIAHVHFWNLHRFNCSKFLLLCAFLIPCVIELSTIDNWYHLLLFFIKCRQLTLVLIGLQTNLHSRTVTTLVALRLFYIIRLFHLLKCKMAVFYHRLLSFYIRINLLNFIKRRIYSW